MFLTLITLWDCMCAATCVCHMCMPHVYATCICHHLCMPHGNATCVCFVACQNNCNIITIQDKGWENSLLNIWLCYWDKNHYNYVLFIRLHVRCQLCVCSVAISKMYAQNGNKSFRYQTRDGPDTMTTMVYNSPFISELVLVVSMTSMVDYFKM